MNVLVKILLIMVILTTLGNLVGQVVLWAPPAGGNDTAIGGGDTGSGEEEKKPEVDVQLSVNVTPDADGKVPAGGAVINGDNAIVTIPAGVQMAEGATSLTLTVNGKEDSEADVDLAEDEVQNSLDVHVEGVAKNNTVPMEIKLLAAAVKGLNTGNIKLYHVDNGETVEMTRVTLGESFTAHNQFKYDPATGDITLYMASFSEVAVVANTVNAWSGARDYNWYTAGANQLTIANADQLAGFGAIVGGMDGQTQDSFAGKIVKLVADINIGDVHTETVDASENGIVFYPIGYYNSDGTYEKTNTAITSGFKKFEGTFDGNGHTIANWYQNTWEMKGDHNWYDATLQYYRDGMGLFGKVYGGTVKNLVIDNFSSDGEITTTGTIAAYADCGATFENIAIFNCNPRVYNIGNGGIVGCVGWYANDPHTAPVTFKNITVDNSNKISALWGSWDVACGGIVGQYYPTSGQSNAIDNGGIYMENCHAAAQIDVYNDVCANYQYYAYRYAGILIGSVRENTTDANGNSIPNMDGITFSGCTVHFGDWNDYYYCEIVANSLASYTHDHQMSRLTQVAKVEGTTITYLDGTTGTVPTSGWAHYVVVKAQDANGAWIHGDGADYATCYHFQNGEVWTHEQGGYEEKDINGDGVVDSDVLKEDKQLVYREFNNLVTGYGWGVTSKGITEYEGQNKVDKLDVTEATSIDKFEKNPNASGEYRDNMTITVGKLFQAIDGIDSTLAIKNGQVWVAVSPKLSTDSASTAGGIYTPNPTDWTKGSIQFTGTGAAVVTITDYYFCKTFKIELNIVENAVTGITVKTNKNLYDIAKGETFSASDLTVTAAFSDGTARVVTDYTVKLAEGTNFATFGEKAGTVTYEYATDTVTADFKVVCVNVTELTNMVGVPEVEGEQRIQRYFEQFGINAVGQKFYTAPGSSTVDMNLYGDSTTLSFATGTVNYTINSHAGLADTVANPDEHGQLTINCTAAPFADIFGYVGYADRVPIAFGVYVDTVDNLTYTAVMEGNADITKLTGTENGRIFYIQAPLNTMNLSTGEHKVHFISIFEDGIVPLTTWTVNIEEKPEVDLSQKTANVIVLAGQSNAYGASALTQAVNGAASSADYSNIFIHYSNINCENEVWKSLYYNSDFEPYAPGVGGTVNGACFGPEAGIAYQLATNEATKDEVWYIIKYTAAGTILNGQWLKGTNGYDNYGLVDDMGGYLSDLMINYIDSSLAKIAAIHGDNINMHSFVWMQGESDSLNVDWANQYQANEAALANKVRSEFASYANNGNGNNIIFISGAIAKYADIDITLTGEKASNGWVYSDTVNNAKKTNALIEWEPLSNTISNPTPCVLSNSVWIDTSSLLVGANAGENNDVYHYSSQSMWNLGNWFGIAINYVNGLGLNNVEPGVQYTVTYDANGGTCGTASATAESGKTVTLPTPTREGYRFDGWSDGTNTYAAGTSYTVTAGVTLTAQWKQLYNITYPSNSVNSITTSVDKTEAVNGETVTITLNNTSTSYSYKTVYVTVTDSNGNTLSNRQRVRLSRNGSQNITFTVQTGDVTITVSQN